MRIDIEWLGEMLQRDLDPEQLARQLTLGGLEVESVRLADAGGSGAAAVDGVVLDFDITPNQRATASAYWGSPGRCPRSTERAWSR